MTASAVDETLGAARNRIAPRVTPRELDAEIAGGALVIDTRSLEDRTREGDLAGAIVVERNVLEWRLDPTSTDRLASMDDSNRRVIIVCNEGFASSLAAAALADLGLTNVTDLAGGFRAWMALAHV